MEPDSPILPAAAGSLPASSPVREGQQPAREGCLHESLPAGAEQPDDQTVVERVLRRLEAARDILPERIAGQLATRGGGGGGAQANPASNPYRALGEGGR